MGRGIEHPVRESGWKLEGAAESNLWQ